jgi:hypothetical protein
MISEKHRLIIIYTFSGLERMCYKLMQDSRNNFDLSHRVHDDVFRTLGIRV